MLAHNAEGRTERREVVISRRAQSILAGRVRRARGALGGPGEGGWKAARYKSGSLFMFMQTL